MRKNRIVKNPLTQVFNLIEERLVRDEIHATHTVRIDGQEMGVLPQGVYAQFMVDTLRTPKIYVKQAFNLWWVFMQVMWHLIKFIPVYAFWLALYGYLYHRTGFLSAYHGLIEGKYDVHMLQSLLEILVLLYVMFLLMLATVTKVQNVGILFGFNNEFKKHIENDIKEHFGVHRHSFRLVEVLNNEREKQWEQDLLRQIRNPHGFKVHGKD